MLELFVAAGIAFGGGAVAVELYCGLVKGDKDSAHGRDVSTEKDTTVRRT